MADTTVDLKELLETGAHFGHQARRWNPKMKKYIYTTRDGVHIFDLAITAKNLSDSINFVRETVASGKEVVFVGGKRQAQAIVKEEAIQAGAPYVTERWLGGMLTNWEMMEGRIKKLKDMKLKREKGELNHYTKRELVLVDREIAKLERFFGGISRLTKPPEVLFIIDTHRETAAVKEAAKLGVKIVGMVDSNADPDLIDFVIPVNDDAVRSIKYVVNKIAVAYKEGMELRSKLQVTSNKLQETHSAVPSSQAKTQNPSNKEQVKQVEKVSKSSEVAKPAVVKADKPAVAKAVADKPADKKKAKKSK